MKRSSYITWDQLKVGVLILVALLILAVAVLKLGQAGNLFGKRYYLVAFVANAGCLLTGVPVTVAGQQAGIINYINYRQPEADKKSKL
jgi:ABC-type transporter Mla subunit MlaD